MHDHVAQEQKRLSATWLNIIAAGLASAGLLPLVHQVAINGWRGMAGDEGLAAALCIGASGGLHALARRLLRSSAK